MNIIKQIVIAAAVIGLTWALAPVISLVWAVVYLNPWLLIPLAPGVVIVGYVLGNTADFELRRNDVRLGKQETS